MNEIIKIYYININNLSNNYYNVPLIKDEDVAKVLKYDNIIKQKQEIASLYLKRKFIKDYYLDENGKPVSKNIFFNISHSKDYVLIAISEKYDIGIDIEYKNNRNVEKLKNYICSKEELDFIKSNDDFYKIWVSKESLFKCCGKGIIMDLKSIDSLPFDGLKIHKGNNYYSHYFDYDNYAISITLRNDNDFKYEINEEII